MPKHVAVLILVMNCILLSTYIGCINCKGMRGVSNIISLCFLGIKPRLPGCPPLNWLRSSFVFLGEVMTFLF
jgi:hypothetical protein